MGISVVSKDWLFHPLFPGQIGIWECWFLWRKENRSKTLETGMRTNNKLNPHNYGINTGNQTRATLVPGGKFFKIFNFFYFLN